ncbi:MAG: biopolymer transporter ExbD [Bacteroidales bacterium]|nr:biopolymer transporter ExbD [Bacteroidales bacterium]
MARREVPDINAGSMADIAFLLLIFFLVTTTMATDTGLMRKLPPLQDPNQEQDDDQQIHERNILVVKVNKDNMLLVEGEIIQIGELRDITKEFILNPNDAEDLPEKIDKNIPYFGLVRVAKQAVISLQNDYGTTYGVYIAVQNELLAARDEVRNNLAIQTWGIPYDDLDENRMAAVDEYYNAPISEAEPKKIGGE